MRFSYVTSCKTRVDNDVIDWWANLASESCPLSCLYLQRPFLALDFDENQQSDVTCTWERTNGLCPYCLHKDDHSTTDTLKWSLWSILSSIHVPGLRIESSRVASKHQWQSTMDPSLAVDTEGLRINLQIVLYVVTNGFSHCHRPSASIRQPHYRLNMCQYSGYSGSAVLAS